MHGKKLSIRTSSRMCLNHGHPKGSTFAMWEVRWLLLLYMSSLQGYTGQEPPPPLLVLTFPALSPSLDPWPGLP